MRVTLCDVGPRDGLQNEPETLAPAVRAELVNRLAAGGLSRIEAVSFVRDERVPQMAGAEEVVARLERRDGVEYAGLVLNERGYERFAASGLDRLNVTFGATEGFNRA
jgi:isopropylmalate/homocitrate/citramalate synthase